MASQNRKDIIAALVSQIETEVTDLNLVTYDSDYYHSEGLSPGQYPACIILDGPAQSGTMICKTQELVMDLKARVIADIDTSDDEVRDFFEAIVDAVNTDISLGETCLSCLWKSDELVSIWPSGTRKFMDVAFAVTYWRDFVIPARVFILQEDEDYLLQETGDKIYSG